MIKIYTTLMLSTLLVFSTAPLTAMGDIDLSLDSPPSEASVSGGSKSGTDELDLGDDVDLEDVDLEGMESDDVSASAVDSSLPSAEMSGSGGVASDNSHGSGDKNNTQGGSSSHTTPNDKAWEKNAAAFGNKSLERRVNRIHKMMARPTNPLTAESVQKKITDLTAQMTAEKDQKKQKKLKRKMKLLEFQLAIVTENCPSQFHLKTAANDAKTQASFDEKTWKKRAAYIQHLDLMILMQKALKMGQPEKDLLKAVWEGNYPKKSTPHSNAVTEHSAPQGSGHHSAAPSHVPGAGGHVPHNPQPPQAPLLK